VTTITATPDAPNPPWPARDDTAGVYGITIAADLAGMSVQAPRLYERKELQHWTLTTFNGNGVQALADHRPSRAAHPVPRRTRIFRHMDLERADPNPACRWSTAESRAFALHS